MGEKYDGGRHAVFILNAEYISILSKTNDIVQGGFRHIRVKVFKNDRREKATDSKSDEIVVENHQLK